jgi:hypothetical protein
LEGQTGEVFFVDDESTGTEGDDEDEGWDDEDEGWDDGLF